LSRSLKISLGFVAVFVGLALLGAIFGGGLPNPLPRVQEIKLTMPNNMVLVAPLGKIKTETDAATHKTTVVAADGFQIMREVPAKYEPPPEKNPCVEAPDRKPELALKEVREERHYGAVVGSDLTTEEKNGVVYVRAPNGAGMFERRASFRGFWTWVAAFLTLCILSFLYDDNPFYKFTEHLFIGVSAAYWMCVGFWSVIVPNLLGKLWPSLVARINPGIGGEPANWLYLIPLAFGILLLMRLSPKGGWLSRWALAFIVGTTAGLNFVGYLQSDFVGQIEGAIGPLVAVDPVRGFQLGATVTAVLMFVGVLTCLVYFFFSSEHKGVMGAASRVGIWVLMVTFGASFGYTVMGRLALLVARMEFLFSDWLNIILK
jgi:hypothetical protein